MLSSYTMTVCQKEEAAKGGRLSGNVSFGLLLYLSPFKFHLNVLSILKSNINIFFPELIISHSNLWHDIVCCQL